jgi:succinyl-CoA synthetase beta subunit
MVGSPIGGMDIEEVAEKQPDKIFKSKIDYMKGISHEQAIQMAKNLDFTGLNIEIVIFLLNSLSLSLVSISNE